MGKRDMNPIRQGDVILLPVDQLPETARKHARGGTRDGGPNDLILASGEVTGHHHRIKSTSAQEYRTGTGRTQRRFLKVHRAVNLTHEEHDTLKVPAGDYEIIRQREYAPQARQVYVYD